MEWAKLSRVVASSFWESIECWRSLAIGGMADLYLALSEGPAGFSKLFVIKRLRNADDPQHVAMFLDEARLAARLSHPNIVETYEIGEEHGAALHGDGAPARSDRAAAAPALLRHGRIPAAIELEIMCNVLEGLHHAHELCGYDGKPLQVVHRDLSPENVIVTRLGECKVLDFGIAKTLDSLSHTEAGFYKGKLTKMPPEQMLGETVDRRADIFAAGVMLWEGLAGRSLWGDLGGPAIAHCLASRDIPPLPTNADVPEDLKWICARAIHADPEGRWTTAQEFRAALQTYMQQHQLVVTRAQLGAFVEPLFADERERLNKILGARMLPRERTDLSTGALSVPTRSEPYYERVELEGFSTSLFGKKQTQPPALGAGGSGAPWGRRPSPRWRSSGCSSSCAATRSRAPTTLRRSPGPRRPRPIRWRRSCRSRRRSRPSTAPIPPGRSNLPAGARPGSSPARCGRCPAAAGPIRTSRAGARRSASAGSSTARTPTAAAPPPPPPNPPTAAPSTARTPGNSATESDPPAPLAELRPGSLASLGAG